jgi:DNA topoisomerase-1
MNPKKYQSIPKKKISSPKSKTSSPLGSQVTRSVGSPFQGLSLVLVESPSKAKTIQGYLGEGYRVEATGGHIMDLPTKQFAVDLSNRFQITKEILPSKKKTIQNLEKFIKNSQRIYLATDPDREGEAIAFDIKEYFSGKLPKIEWVRVRFQEITKDHVLEKIQSPDSLREATKEAQETRRVLDRIFGYTVSPILWKKIGSGLSAGRVQSVVLRWICEREEEIRNFIPEINFEYSLIHLDDQGLERSFRLLSKEKIRDPGLIPGYFFPNQPLSQDSSPETSLAHPEFIRYPLEGVSMVLKKPDRKITKERPPLPFRTSSLQEFAAKRWGFPLKKTMKLAQSLYEGIDLDRGKRVGLITYPRTDSTRVSPEFEAKVRSAIEKTRGKEFLGSKIARKSQGNIQDAHECIRPTDLDLSPDQLRPFLSKDEAKLYEAIYRRIWEAYSAEANWEEIVYRFEKWNHTWEHKQRSLEFPGWKIWSPGEDSEKKLWIPEIGKPISLSELLIEQKKSNPPSRFNYGSLVKKMESSGVGRPSTYSQAIEILLERKYVGVQEKYFYPYPLGEAIYGFLKSHFSDLIQDGFTMDLEEKLDRVESNELTRIEILTEFYSNLKQVIEKIPSGKLSVTNRAEKPTCPICNQGKVYRKPDRKGRILKYCSRFPECDYGEYET